MTIAEQARSYRNKKGVLLWPKYVAALNAGDRDEALAIAKTIQAALGLTDRQRLVNLPKIARQSSTRGKPRKARCEHCGQVLR